MDAGRGNTSCPGGIGQLLFRDSLAPGKPSPGGFPRQAKIRCQGTLVARRRTCFHSGRSHGAFRQPPGPTTCQPIAQSCGAPRRPGNSFCAACQSAHRQPITRRQYPNVLRDHAIPGGNCHQPRHRYALHADRSPGNGPGKHDPRLSGAGRAAAVLNCHQQLSAGCTFHQSAQPHQASVCGLQLSAARGEDTVDRAVVSRWRPQVHRHHVLAEFPTRYRHYHLGAGSAGMAFRHL